jgi:hypothetical protein
MSVFSKAALQSIFDGWPSGYGGWTIRLFKNNLTPTVDNVAGDFTESTASGYAAQGFANTGGDTWDATNKKWTRAYGTYTFTGTGVANENVYGFYVLDNTGAVILSKRFAGAPLVLGVAGTTIQIQSETWEAINEFTS